MRAPSLARSAPIIAPTQERPPLLFDASQSAFVSRPMARPSVEHPHASADARLLRPADTVAPQPLRSPGVPSPLQLAQAGVVSAPDGASFTGDSSGAIEPLESERPAPGHAPGTPPDRPADLMAPPRPLGMDEAFRGSGRRAVAAGSDLGPIASHIRFDPAGSSLVGGSLMQIVSQQIGVTGTSTRHLNGGRMSGQWGSEYRSAARALRDAFNAVASGLDSGGVKQLRRRTVNALAANIHAARLAEWRAGGRRPPKPRLKDSRKAAEDLFNDAMTDHATATDHNATGAAVPTASGDGSGGGFCPCPCSTAWTDSAAAGGPEEIDESEVVDAPGGKGDLGAILPGHASGPAPHRVADLAHAGASDISEDGTFTLRPDEPTVIVADERPAGNGPAPTGAPSEGGAPAPEEKPKKKRKRKGKSPYQAFRDFFDATVELIVAEATARLGRPLTRREYKAFLKAARPLIEVRWALVLGRQNQTEIADFWDEGLDGFVDPEKRADFITLQILGIDLQLAMNQFELLKLLGAHSRQDAAAIVRMAETLDLAHQQRNAQSGGTNLIKTESGTFWTGYLGRTAVGETLFGDDEKALDLPAPGSPTEEEIREARSLVKTNMPSSWSLLKEAAGDWIGKATPLEITAAIGAGVALLALGGIAFAAGSALGSAAAGVVGAKGVVATAAGLAVGGALSGAMVDLAVQMFSPGTEEDKDDGIDWGRVGQSALIGSLVGMVLGPALQLVGRAVRATASLVKTGVGAALQAALEAAPAVAQGVRAGTAAAGRAMKTAAEYLGAQLDEVRGLVYAGIQRVRETVGGRVGGRVGMTETIEDGGGRFARAAAGASGKKPLPIPKDLPWRYAKPGELGPGELGSTSKTGDIIIRPGLEPRLESEVIRHEAGHRFLTPLGEGPVTAFRQNAMDWMYRKSVVMRVLEEGAVQTYGTRSLLRGVSLPFNGGYSLAPGWGDLVLVGGVGGIVYVVAKAPEWSR
ncbi:MAG: hypothetical protein HMLKMBBP_02617 [Planctomycetes bacterium]|nr:hypothetical protein [Planctomycetota bacterium]